MLICDFLFSISSMNSSLLIWQLFWPMLVIMGLAMMINPIIVKYIQRIESTPLSLFLESTFRSGLWLILVTLHNSWDWFLNIAISILSRTILAFGVIGLFAPKLLKSLDKTFYKSELMINAWIILVISIWFIITYISYISI